MGQKSLRVPLGETCVKRGRERKSEGPVSQGLKVQQYKDESIRQKRVKKIVVRVWKVLCKQGKPSRVIVTQKKCATAQHCHGPQRQP